jgi:hypothetical protein
MEWNRIAVVVIPAQAGKGNAERPTISWIAASAFGLLAMTIPASVCLDD